MFPIRLHGSYLTMFFMGMILCTTTTKKCYAQNDKGTGMIVAVFEAQDNNELGDIFRKKMQELNKAMKTGQNQLDTITISLNQNNEQPAFTKVCELLTEGITLIIDCSWEGWVHIQSLASGFDIPYLRCDVTNSHYVGAMEKYLRFLEATNAVVIAPDASQMEQALSFLVGNTIVRFLIVDGSSDSAMKGLANRKPVPKYHVFLGNTAQLYELAHKVKSLKMLDTASKSIFVRQDSGDFNITNEPELAPGLRSILSVVGQFCCLGLPSSRFGCPCENLKERFVEAVAATVSEYFKTEATLKVVADCKNFSAKMPDPVTNNHAEFYESFKTRTQLHLAGLCLQWKAIIKVDILHNTKYTPVGTWNYEYGVFTPVPNINVVDVYKLRFFRIGVVWEVPFLYNKTNEDGILERDDKGNNILQGYCIDLINKLADAMKFQYTLVIVHKDELEERRSNGTWGGLFGTLIAGELDFILAPLVITAEKEEAVDFVAPYFEQTGIAIVMNRAKKPTSVFKFMSVLKDEVWLCILGALIITAIVLYIVDKSSPYSGKNKKLYPYKCREFTFGECFWFVLTSVTPQGGGEPPKAVSGRVLVASYWIFVVLMLATFTANLAAFLTVERMQTPVRSLDELAVQSKIHYTVVENSSTHQFFINMANAENELAKIWKDMTLNATGDEQEKYRVWDYPIREQFGRILGVIDMREKMKDEAQGFEKVKWDENFAFMHDALRVKHVVYNNCNLTLVGEAFAEQPYAVAVQSGSHLQEEIAKHFLIFQKDREFEKLSTKHWNSTECETLQENENADGITLDSIGGVFIITLAGLGIGMLTLVGEIIMYRYDNKSKVVAIRVRPKKSMAGH